MHAIVVNVFIIYLGMCHRCEVWPMGKSGLERAASDRHGLDRSAE